MPRAKGIGIYETTVYQVGRYNITAAENGLTIVENEGAQNQHKLLIDPVAAKYIGDVLNKAAATIPAPKRIRKPAQPKVDPAAKAKQEKEQAIAKVTGQPGQTHLDEFTGQPADNRSYEEKLTDATPGQPGWGG